jgi:hypothetical protein
MKRLLAVLSWTGLFLTLVPSILLMASLIDDGLLKVLMFVGMLCWFIGRIQGALKQ